MEQEQEQALDVRVEDPPEERKTPDLRSFLIHQTRFDGIAISFIYGVDLLASMLFLSAELFVYHDLTANFFMLFKSFACGVALLLNLWCIRVALDNHRAFHHTPALIFLIVVQAAQLLVGFGRGFVLHDFWETGYVFYLFRAILIICYVRRYFRLKRVWAVILEETEEPT